MSEAAIEAPEPEEQALNPRALTAHEQGSEIPLGWKPTATEPVPVVRCVQIKRDGDRCKNWSLRGYTKCRKHAGPGYAMKDGNVQKYAEAVIEAARLRLIDSSDMALDTLIELAQPGTSEGIRLKAATEVLDRSGIRGGFEVKVDQQVTVNAADEIQARLAKLKAGADAVQRMKDAAASEDDEEILDGEVVEDEQDTLF
jgi:hypothetical protein